MSEFAPFIYDDTRSLQEPLSPITDFDDFD
jgi:hypothetical protein